MNFGQILGWISLLASLAAGLLFMAAAGGRESALKPARIAFGVQWLALLGRAGLLWYILFNHQFQYQYVASYSSHVDARRTTCTRRSGAGRKARSCCGRCSPRRSDWCSCACGIR